MTRIRSPLDSTQSEAPDKPINEARHEARCGICTHPERLAIEEAFLYRRFSVAEITRRYGIGHDAVYRHAHALNLLASRNGNGRAPVESDNSCAPVVGVKTWEAVRQAEVPCSSPHAQTIVELLQIPRSTEILVAIDRAIEFNLKESSSVDDAANAVFVAAALAKIGATPDNWLTWFQQLPASGS